MSTAPDQPAKPRPAKPKPGNSLFDLVLVILMALVVLAIGGMMIYQFVREAPSAGSPEK